MRRQTLIVGAAVIAVLIAIFFAVSGMDAQREFVLHEAERYAHDYLANPETQALNIVGERALLIGCQRPQTETLYQLYEKRRYDFKVTCADGRVGFLTVSMRSDPPQFIGVSRKNPILSGEAAKK